MQIRTFPSSYFLTQHYCRAFSQSENLKYGPKLCVKQWGQRNPYLDRVGSGNLRELLFTAPGFGRIADQSLRLALCGDVELTDDEQIVRGFINRIKEVKRVAPPDSLLVFEVKDGWKPLCRFLNQTIFNVSFPHINDPNVL